MSSSAQDSSTDAQVLGDPEDLMGKERRWIRQHVELAEELVALEQPFDNRDVLRVIRREEYDVLSEGDNTEIQQRYAPFDGKRRVGGDRVYYTAKSGVEAYVREWKAQRREFECCNYPDGFSTESDGLYCNYCGAELDRETVREADL